MDDPPNRPNYGLREEYALRINRVLDYIESRLDRELTLDELAGVANFSRFHFHRVFKAMVGETLNRFTNRLRLEKAAAQLVRNPRKSVTEIALDCGFSGSATFSRAFREAFGASPTEWRKAGGNDLGRQPEQNSSIRQTIGNPRKDGGRLSFYIDRQTQSPIWRLTMKANREIQVEIKELPELSVAYVRHIGPYKGNSALFEDLFTRLMAWAAPRDLLRFPGTQVLAVYHDDPDLTEEEKLRVSACVTVPPDTPAEGEVGRMTVPGGRFAVARFEVDPDGYEEAWNALMKDWLPESGFQPDDRLCYESFLNDPKQHPEGKHIFDICFPVRPL